MELDPNSCRCSASKIGGLTSTSAAWCLRFNYVPIALWEQLPGSSTSDAALGRNAQIAPCELEIGQATAIAFRRIGTSGGLYHQAENLLISRIGFGREKEIDFVDGESATGLPIGDLQDGEKGVPLSRVFGNRSDEYLDPAGAKSSRVLNPVLRLCIHNMETWYLQWYAVSECSPRHSLP